MAFGAISSEADAEPSLSVVVPVYQEAQRLPEMLAKLCSYLDANEPGSEILVVDDGSSDDTLAVAERCLSGRPGARVLSNAPHRGKGAAVCSGLLAARGRFVLFADADASTPIEEEQRLRAAIEAGADVAIASRRIAGSHVFEEANRIRRIWSAGFNLLVRGLGLSAARDTQCGFKMMKRSVAEEVVPRMQCRGFAFDVELLARVHRADFQIAEVPVRWTRDADSRVDLLRDPVRMVRDLFRIRLAVGRGRSRAMRSRLALIVAVLVGLVLARAMTLSAFPIWDNSESRYAEIGRKMAASGDWISPRLASGRPFWGKPPLHFWATMASVDAFGATELAARVPSFAAGLLVLAITFGVARRSGPLRTALLAALILGSSALFYFLWATCLTDMTLAACNAATLGLFFVGMRETTSRGRARLLSGLLFASLGLGLLAKGPVSIVLAAGSIGAWSLITGDWSWLRRLRWLEGVAVTLAVSLPWYLASESETPGFLRYFLLHENLLRFLGSDYGDLYGNGHPHFRGAIWWMLVAATLPWSPIVVWLACRRQPLWRWRELRADPESAFLVAWALVPIVFFTLSRNVVITYVLPSLPPLSILTARLLVRSEVSRPLAVTACAVLAGTVLCMAGLTPYFDLRLVDLAALAAVLAVSGALACSLATRGRIVALLVTAAIVPLAVGSIGLLMSQKIGARSSTKELSSFVDSSQLLRKCPVSFYDGLPFSAEFYLRDRLRGSVRDAAALRAIGAADSCQLVAVKVKQVERFDAVDPRGFHAIREIGEYVLYGNDHVLLDRRALL